MHKCGLCGKVLSNGGYLRKHIASIHCESKKMSCDLCSKVFFFKALIRSHMKVHMKKKFACNVCDYKTAFKNNLQVHKETHADKVACAVCKKQVASLKLHMLMHKPKVSCQICQKLLGKEYMKKHMEIHIGRSIRCDNCDDFFVSKRELRR